MTATRRGLALIAYSEAALVVCAILFVVFPTRPTLLIIGIAASLLFGAPAGLALWAGRREFGKKQERDIPRATLAFSILLGSLLLAFFQVTSVFPESMQLRDLYAPFAFLGFALVADAAGMVLLLRPLLPAKRWPLYAIAALALVGTIVYGVRGAAAVHDLIVRSETGVALVPAEAASYARDFVMFVVRDWTVALLALRIGFWPGLYFALANVAQAEQEADARVASPTIAPPT